MCWKVGYALRVTTNSRATVLGDATKLDILHALKKSEELLRQRVVIESGTFEGEE